MTPQVPFLITPNHRETLEIARAAPKQTTLGMRLLEFGSRLNAERAREPPANKSRNTHVRNNSWICTL
jgi:hypothetical protein